MDADVQPAPTTECVSKYVPEKDWSDYTTAHLTLKVGNKLSVGGRKGILFKFLYKKTSILMYLLLLQKIRKRKSQGHRQMKNGVN